MNDEKECYDVAEPRPYEFDFPASISFPVESSVARFARSLGRYIFNNYAWTYGDVANVIGGDRKALRREGAKIGQRFRGRSRCVWVLPDCLCGVKPILIGVYHHNIDFATFTSVYFAPKRKASMIANQLLKSPEGVRRKFRARTDKSEIAFYNGRFNVYSD